jgi:hypothetical protein
MDRSDSGTMLFDGRNLYLASGTPTHAGDVRLEPEVRHSLAIVPHYHRAPVAHPGAAELATLHYFRRGRPTRLDNSRLDTSGCVIDAR